MHKNSLQQIIPQLEKTLGKKIQYNEDALVQDMRSERKYDIPLYIKVLSIFGGLLGSLALLGFLILAGLYDSKLGLTISGILAILGAVWVNKIFHNLLLDTGSVSVYVIGYGLLGFGLVELNVNDNLVCLLFILAALATAFISNSVVLVFISILIISGGLLAFGFINELFHLTHAYIAFYSLALTAYYLFEPKFISRFPKLIDVNSALRVGLIFSFIMGLSVVGIRGITPLSYQYVWISSIFTIACTLIVLSQVLPILNITERRQQLFIYIGSIIVLLPTGFSPAISGAVLLMLLNYKISYKTGLYIGVIAFLYFLSRFYYDLNFTLLFKSALLLISGIAFMIFYFLLHKYFKHEKI